jgi:hypothetical protein
MLNPAQIRTATVGTPLAGYLSVTNTEPQQTTSSTSERPVCDEWGFYDPEQAGFEAIVRRLLPAAENDVRRAQAPALPRVLAASTRSL